MRRVRNKAKKSALVAEVESSTASAVTLAPTPPLTTATAAPTKIVTRL